MWFLLFLVKYANNSYYSELLKFHGYILIFLAFFFNQGRLSSDNVLNCMTLSPLFISVTELGILSIFSFLNYFKNNLLNTYYYSHYTDEEVEHQYLRNISKGIKASKNQLSNVHMS